MRILTPLLLIAALVSASPAEAGIEPPSLVYRGASAPLKAGAIGKSVVAKCPKGTRVIGGGAQVLDDSGASRLVGSHPFDGRDADRKPDDGWRAVATNLTPVGTHLNVWAVCDEAKGFAYRYVKSKAKLPAGQMTVIASCAATESVAGGGALIKGKAAHLHLVMSHPADDLIRDGTPDNGWSATGENNTTRTYELSTWAICTESGSFTYPETQSPMESSGGMVNIRADCSAPLSRVTGGGFDVFGEGATILMATRPYTDDPDGIVDDGWSAVARNLGEAEVVRVIAICLGPPSLEAP